MSQKIMKTKQRKGFKLLHKLHKNKYLTNEVKCVSILQLVMIVQ